MVEKAASQTPRRGLPVTEHPGLDQTIVRIISKEGDAAFRTILSGVKEQFSVSRETVAHHVAHMLRFSQVVRLRHGHYAVGSSSTPPSMVLRMRTVSINQVLSLDGSSEFQLEKEFLVLSGKCDHISSVLEPATRIRVRGMDAAGLRRVRVAASMAGGKNRVRARLIPSIPAGPWISHRLLMSFSIPPHYYVMQTGPESSLRPASLGFPWNHHLLGVVSNPEPGTIIETGKDTVLDLRVHFPRGFPRGKVRPSVTPILAGWGLAKEATDLLRLSKKSRGAWGLTIHENLVTMRVKNPRIDCYYGFEWAPAKAGAYAHWLDRLLSDSHGRSAKFV